MKTKSARTISMPTIGNSHHFFRAPRNRKISPASLNRRNIGGEGDIQYLLEASRARMAHIVFRAGAHARVE